MGAQQKPQDEPKVHHAVEAETAILGGLMMGASPETTDPVFEQVRPEMFFLGRHAKIFEVIVSLKQDGRPFELPDVAEALADRGIIEEVGGGAYLSSLFTGPVSFSLDGYVATLARTYRMRRYTRYLDSLGRMLQSSSSEEQFVRAAQRGIQDLVNDFDVHLQTQGTSFYQAGLELLTALSENEKDAESRIGTGITDIDNMTGGMHPGELVVVTADTGVGKTVLAQQCRRNACDRRQHTLYCSGEMFARHLVAREVAALAHVAQEKMRRPELITEGERAAILTAISHQCQSCRILDGTLKLTRIQAAARRMKRTENGLHLVVIDYDELVEVEGGKDEWEEQKRLAYAAKGIAIENNCTVILISQLRKPLQGEDRAKPRIQSLYGSGAKAKHASIVLYVDREYVRELEGDETKARVFVLKSRDGKVGRVDCRFNVRQMRFDMAPEGQDPR